MVLKTGAIFGHPGLQPPTTRPDYATYRSPHGPQMTTQTNFRGINQRVLTVFGKSAGLFGATAAVAALYFASGIPRVQVDILQKIPFVGSFYHHEVAPEDNPF